MVPEVWVPPAHLRELRALVAHRKRLISQRTQARNRKLALEPISWVHYTGTN